MGAHKNRNNQKDINKTGQDRTINILNVHLQQNDSHLIQ